MNARRVLELHEEHQAKQILTKAAHEFLNELADFSSRITDPEWMKTLEGGDGEKPTRWPAQSPACDRSGDQARSGES